MEGAQFAEKVGKIVPKRDQEGNEIPGEFEVFYKNEFA